MNEQHFRRVLDAQHELICEWSPDGTIVFFNAAYREFFGYPADMEGRTLDDLVDWAEGEGPEHTVHWLEQGHAALVTERTYADDRAVEWTDTAYRDATGRLESVVSVGRDITAKVTAERTLAATQARHRVMTQYTLDSVVLMTADAHVVDSTSRHRFDLGYPPETWQQTSPFEMLHPEDRDAARDAFASLVNRGPNAEEWFECRLRRVDDTYSVVEVTAVNLLHDPAVHAIVLTLRNIDRRKAVELELARRRDEAESALRQRIAFVAQVSHELRNPLHGMLGLSEVLTKSYLPGDLADAAWGIFRQSSTMRRIVDDLLDVAQIEVGHLRVRPEIIDLQFAFNDCAFIARKSLAPGVRLVVDEMDAELRHLFADPDRVRQAVTNLLSNACKYTTAGEIRLAVSPGAGTNMARVEVADTGVGITPDDVHRYFEPYERGENERSPGVGLGLTIVKGTVEAMGGTVGASPRRGGGSVFWFELPLASVASAAVDITAPIVSAAEPPAVKMRTLVVDDDPVNLMLAGMQLTTLGHDVVTAANGEDALVLLREEQFDVALVDVQMPGMSGLDLVRVTRRFAGTAPLMAVMTASATAADRQAALEAGADMFVPKPASVADVREVVRRRLEQVGT